MGKADELGLKDEELLSAYKEHCEEMEYRVFVAEFNQTKLIVNELVAQLDVDAPPGLDTDKFHERTRKRIDKARKKYSNMRDKMLKATKVMY